MIAWVATLVAAYALGCLNTGYYLVRARTGEDLRARGSGTAGATNTGRLLGRAGFVAAMLGDVLKGVLAVLLGRWALGEPGAALAAATVVAGHIYPVQLGFRGGKGLATAFGAAVVLVPVVSAIAIAAAAATLGLTRLRVVSALAGVAAAPLAALALHGPGWAALGLAILGLIVFVRHWPGRDRPGPRVRPSPPAGPASPAAD